jgi:poly(3-hydroxybutyrate) depolymerase
MNAERSVLSFWLVSLLGCGSSHPSSMANAAVANSAQDSGAAEASASAADASASPPSSCTLDDVSPGQHAYPCDGLTYDVHIPASCASSPCGLIADVHGLSMSGKMEDNNTNLRQLGEQNGYVIVQPNAVPAPPASSFTPATDDPKVFAFIQLAVSRLSVDPKRVHMTGFSEGGFMTYRFLCNHADYFASVAPAAGAGCSFGVLDAGSAARSPISGADGVPAREIAVLAMNGTQDALVNFNNRAIPQRDAIVTGWNMDSGTQVAGDGTFKRTRYTSPSGNVFEFLQHDYSSSQTLTKGHCFPGSKDLNGGEPGQVFGFACQPPNSFVWGDEVMKFFIAHPK